tara:strand:+ start:3289 stop:3738 length:450 start_codon:yes stop_codon:yes gene_type:complete
MMNYATLFADGLKTFRPEGSKNDIEYLTFDEFIEVEAQDLNEIFGDNKSGHGTQDEWQEFCLWVYKNEGQWWAYPTQEQFKLICTNDQVAQMETSDVQMMEAFLRPVLDELRDRKELKGILGIDRMTHQDAQTFKMVADEIIKSAIAKA